MELKRIAPGLILTLLSIGYACGSPQDVFGEDISQAHDDISQVHADTRRIIEPDHFCDYLIRLLLPRSTEWLQYLKELCLPEQLQSLLPPLSPAAWPQPQASSLPQIPNSLQPQVPAQIANAAWPQLPPQDYLMPVLPRPPQPQYLPQDYSMPVFPQLQYPPQDYPTPVFPHLRQPQYPPQDYPTPVFPEPKLTPNLISEPPWQLYPFVEFPMFELPSVDNDLCKSSICDRIPPARPQENEPAINNHATGAEPVASTQAAPDDQAAPASPPAPVTGGDQFDQAALGSPPAPVAGDEPVDSPPPRAEVAA